MAKHHPRAADEADGFAGGRESLVALATRIVGNRAIAEELTQEGWLRWAVREYPDSVASRILSRIVKILALDWLRRRRVEIDIHERVFEVSALRVDGIDAERITISRQESKRVLRALEHLPNRTREAFLLSRVQGLTNREIGDRLGVSAPRASQLVKRAMAHLAAQTDP
ncbi:MAG: sigma-70 family RNA polymerase sigma factor [Pseudomonadota bacterium]